MAALKLEDVVASLTDFDDNTNDESNCLTNVPSGTELFSDDGLPPAVCSYYANSSKGVGQGCLRVNCKFFHGTEEQLAELRLRCLLDEPLAAGLNAVGVAKRRKMASEVCNSAKRPIVCLNYLTDACHRPNCRFLHLPPEIRPLPMNICEYFLRGNCTRHRCRFFHGPQEALSKLHADGVTMYNPITNFAYDPKASLEELMHSIPTRAPSHPRARQVAHYVPSQPSQQHIIPQGANTVFIVLNQQPNGLVHVVTQQPDGSVVIQQSPSLASAPPQYHPRPLGSQHQPAMFPHTHGTQQSPYSAQVIPSNPNQMFPTAMPPYVHSPAYFC